jgi:hypothetical protein
MAATTAGEIGRERHLVTGRDGVPHRSRPAVEAGLALDGPVAGRRFPVSSSHPPALAPRGRTRALGRGARGRVAPLQRRHPRRRLHAPERPRDVHDRRRHRIEHGRESVTLPITGLLAPTRRIGSFHAAIGAGCRFRCRIGAQGDELRRRDGAHPSSRHGRVARAASDAQASEPDPARCPHLHPAPSSVTLRSLLACAHPALPAYRGSEQQPPFQQHLPHRRQVLPSMPE